MTETASPEPQLTEPVSPTLHLGAAPVPRSTWLGPAWAVLCGLIASGAFRWDGLDVLTAALAMIVADWAWPSLWTTCVRTDWAAPVARWRDVPSPGDVVARRFLQPGSPGDRLLRWAARVRAWWRSYFAPMAGASLVTSLVALTIALVLSAVIGWRALALTFAALAVTGVGALRALRSGYDPDWLRAIVYGVLPWWLGHAAFAPLTLASAAFGVLYGLAYAAVMDASRVSSTALVAPQVVAAVGLFAGGDAAAAFLVALAITSQAALRSAAPGRGFARLAQAWLMAAMLVCAVAAG